LIYNLGEFLGVITLIGAVAGERRIGAQASLGK